MEVPGAWGLCWSSPILPTPCTGLPAPLTCEHRKVTYAGTQNESEKVRFWGMSRDKQRKSQDSLTGELRLSTIVLMQRAWGGETERGRGPEGEGERRHYSLKLEVKVDRPLGPFSWILCTSPAAPQPQTSRTVADQGWQSISFPSSLPFSFPTCSFCTNSELGLGHGGAGGLGQSCTCHLRRKDTHSITSSSEEMPG